MKILISVFTYYPNKDGVQNVTEYQAEGLAKKGHDVTIITEKVANQPDKEVHNGVNILRIPCHTDYMLHFGNKSMYQKLIIDSSKKFDVIMTVCPETWCTDWVIPIIDQLACPCIMMVHGVHEYDWRKNRGTNLYTITRKIWGDIRWYPFYTFNWTNLRKFDAIIQLHEQDFSTKWFQKHGVSNQHVIYNAVDNRFFDDEIVAKRNQIINVGTYCERKNQKLCLQAFYKSNLKTWNLVLIGPNKNKYYNDLLELRTTLEEKYGHRNVEILSSISRSDTIDMIKMSKLYLMTSITEFFPISLIEAMAAGSAWISTDVGIVKFLPGGFVCSDANEIVNTLNRLDSDLDWKSYGEIGRKYAEKNFKQEIQVTKLEQVMRETIKNRNNC